MNIGHFENFKALFTPELYKLKEIFKNYNHQLCLAGGPVRDILMGIIPEDLDFATCATPFQMKEFFTSENVRMLNKNGEKHGTITVRINDKENFEITTLRIDKATDGRHAEVEFTKNWLLDANRRDLTINSMFLDLEGTLYDFCGGKSDLDERKIVFVGDAETRIKEDYLRILRYFRFYGKISDKEHNHDPKILKILGENSEGLAQISGERLWVELKKICGGQYVYSLFKIIFDLGIASYVGLPAAIDVDTLQELYRVCKVTNGLKPNPVTILVSVLTPQDLKILNQRLKLSNSDLAISGFIIDQRHKDFNNYNHKKSGQDSPHTNGTLQHANKIFQSRDLKYYIDLMVDSKSPGKTKEKIIEYLKYSGEKGLLNDFISAEIPRFPLTGHDLMEMGIPKSPNYANIMQELRNAWKDSKYSLSYQELLQKLKTYTKASS
ncbi:unnamed protein product [Gordionus sp. m RMFG-2023]|uniref:CCA tRNA nucleotidyltransferase 1, mitochondrial-like n=1 Tax=Gordionus sp. m RMFG-2023 TaxID=3053472 RepID=UPI0030E4E205